MKRRIAAVTGTGKVVLVKEPVPELKPGEVLIRVNCSLISPGTEVSGIKAKRENPTEGAEPKPFGYASAGEVIKVCRVDGIQPGMRVAAMGANYAMHTDYACVPVNLVVPIPDGLSFEQATYACLGATALHSVRRTEPQLGEYGVVLGMGIVGNLAAQLLQLSGARILGWESLPNRVKIARDCGIRDVLNLGKDDPVECTRRFSHFQGLDFAVFAFGGNGDDAWKSVNACMQVSADGNRMGRVTLLGGAQLQLMGAAGCGNLDIRSSARTGPGYHDEVYEHGQGYPAGFVPFTTQRNLREVIRLLEERRLGAHSSA